MLIRILEQMEIPNAAGLSRYVFDVCLRNRMEYEQTIGFVEEYLKPDHLLEKIQAGNLIIWGVFEGPQLVAVSGMQSDGLITMLYVLPQCMNRGYGGELLRVMRAYAKNACGMQRVNINATPAWTSGFFAKKGFVYDSQDLHAPFLPMHISTGSNLTYEKKPVSWKVMLGAGIGLFLLATVACVAFLFWYAM